MDERDRLLAAIAADPDAVENWIVYADWLTEREDPRGELINLELAIEAGATDEEVTARHRALMRDEDALLTPRLADHVHHFELGWWRGFIRRAAAFGPDDDLPTSKDLEALYADPHACLLRELTLPPELHHTLATLVCASVRTLTIRVCRVAVLALAQGFPRLAELTLWPDQSSDEQLALEEVVHPELTSFSGPASALYRHDLPRLCSLAVCDDVIALLEPRGILSRPPPSLTTLTGSISADAIAALRTSPSLAQLRKLTIEDLSVEHVDEIARNPAPFQHLELTAWGTTNTDAERDELLRRASELLPLATITVTSMESYESKHPGEPPPIAPAIGDGIGDAIARLAQRMRARNSEDA